MTTAEHWLTTDAPSPVVGWALDGFPIRGPYSQDGNVVTADRLDACNVSACMGRSLAYTRATHLFDLPSH